MYADELEVWMPNPYVGRSDLIFCNRSETPEQNLISLLSYWCNVMWTVSDIERRVETKVLCVFVFIDYSNMFTDKCFCSQSNNILNFCVWKW